MKKFYAVISLLLLFTSQAAAEQYAIHLDTSESLNISDYEALSVYGELYTVEASQGYQSMLLGPYENKRLAGDILNKIRVAGYYGAFIIKQKNERSQMIDSEKHEDSINVTLKDFTANKVISRLD